MTKYRVKEKKGLYYPQFKIALIPFWFNYIIDYIDFWSFRAYESKEEAENYIRQQKQESNK